MIAHKLILKCLKKRVEKFTHAIAIYSSSILVLIDVGRTSPSVSLIIDLINSFQI